jgi:uncharacterized protein YkwD
MLDWLRSPPHRANILDPSYRQMGLSYLAPTRFLNTIGGRLWANDFGVRS